jgi:hypothetical protein
MAHWDGFKFSGGEDRARQARIVEGLASMGNRNIGLPLYERPVGVATNSAPCRDQRCNSSRPASSVALKSLTSITKRLWPIVDKALRQHCSSSATSWRRQEARRA